MSIEVSFTNTAKRSFASLFSSTNTTTLSSVVRTNTNNTNNTNETHQQNKSNVDPSRNNYREHREHREHRDLTNAIDPGESNHIDNNIPDRSDSRKTEFKSQSNSVTKSSQSSQSTQSTQSTQSVVNHDRTSLAWIIINLRTEIINRATNRPNLNIDSDGGNLHLGVPLRCFEFIITVTAKNLRAPPPILQGYSVFQPRWRFGF